MKKHNFSAGPCILPDEVFRQASESIIDYDHSGLSVLEISHRSAAFMAIMEEAQALARELLDIPSNYEVLYIQGGASLQFAMVAQNYMSTHKKGAYIDTGAWSAKAIKEAKYYGEVDVLASSKDKIYSYLPTEFSRPLDDLREYDFLHYTTNNTIYGTQFKGVPQTNTHLTSDMSSDIFSRKIDVSQYSLIYAGAQKNFGPAGAVLIIVDPETLSGEGIPEILRYESHIKAKSIYHTPSVFAVYVSMLTLRWLKKNGGLDWIEPKNEAKAKKLYDHIEANERFNIFVKNPSDRSTMNVVFTLANEEQDKEAFENACKEADIVNLGGHRSVGGYRASIYNAMPEASIDALINVMQTF